MAVKVLKKNSSAAADSCSSSYRSSTGQLNFFSVSSKLAPLISKNHSGKELINSSVSLSTTTTQQISSYCELQRIFFHFNENGDGRISPSELRNCMRVTGEELSSEVAEEAVRLSDSDGDGELGLEDFIKLVDGEDEQEKDKSLMDAFCMYEMDGRGCIMPQSLRRMLRRVGQDPTAEDCIIMIGQFDLNGDGVLFKKF